MGHHDLRRARDRKKGARRKVVERAPIEHLFDDGVLSVHAVILRAYSPAPVARVLEEPVDEDHIASSKLFAPTHLLLHHLAVVEDELKIEIAHRNAGFALAD